MSNGSPFRDVRVNSSPSPKVPGLDADPDRGEVGRDDLRHPVARRPVAGVEDRRPPPVPGEPPRRRQVRVERVDPRVAEAGDVRRQVLVGRPARDLRPRVAERRERGPVDRVVHGPPHSCVGEERPVGVERKHVELGEHVHAEARAARVRPRHVEGVVGLPARDVLHLPARRDARDELDPPQPVPASVVVRVPLEHNALPGRVRGDVVRARARERPRTVRVQRACQPARRRRTAARAASAGRARARRAGSRASSRGPRRPQTWGARPTMYARAPTTSPMYERPGAVELPAEAALDRVRERPRRHGLARREPEPGPDPERVRPAVRRDPRHRRRRPRARAASRPARAGPGS